MQYLLLTLLLTSAVYSGRKIPKNLKFGATSSAYQYEGAWNEEGKGPSIWDVAVHQNPSRIQDGSTGDVAVDTYHLYKGDIQIMSNLGLDFFRFSFSWSRILPTGFANKINRAGIEYYNNFIDELIKHNITPCATIYHWDLPEKLQELGGWTNPYIVEWFEDYANVVYDNYGNKIKMWTTINEPIIICSYGYALGHLAPFVKSPGIGEYLCLKNVLLAHARAYHLYHQHYNADNKGKVGIALNPEWSIPFTPSQEDQEAAIYTFQFSFAIIVSPIFSESGDYPEAVKSRVDAKSSEQGFPRSRLQKLTEQEIEMIKGSADFLGINHYYINYVSKNTTMLNRSYPVPSIHDDIGADITVSVWPKSDVRKSFDPSHLYEILMTVKELYNNPTVYITENGWYSGGGLEDDDRIQYLAGHIDAMLAAVDRGCDVRGYSVWSLLDNFEWSLGYKKKFGLYEVDFSSPNLTRTPRKSAHFYKSILESRTVLGDKQGSIIARFPPQGENRLVNDKV